jgi:hypothetical protein
MVQQPQLGMLTLQKNILQIKNTKPVQLYRLVEMQKLLPAQLANVLLE